MKKIMAITLTMLFILTACSNQIYGKYKVEDNGGTIEIKKNNKVEVSNENEKEVLHGKINKDDKIITLYYENHPMKIDYKLEDDTLKLKLKAGSDEEVVKAKKVK
ncbi:hypothetical protein K1Y28_00955 [Staphylococcus warneri]|nr:MULTISPECIES: hypothetical protein [Staphylococcus]MBE9428232.1 hypothetical protein [Staphylococcus epidermidis]AXV42129.1 hypothetical protein Ssp1_11020 [Staphylococcus sp. M0911]MCD8803208.1 hypothetical protein [Staphylococcus warneri]MCD8806378.1 hypothetical protein [Staphylococcus warneri]MCI2787922.1 hypothetical protein [Staphylococcus warneri]